MAIDNLGVAVWFWITGGVLIAVSASTVDLAAVDLSTKSQQLLGNSRSSETNKKGRSISGSKARRNNSDTEFPIATLVSGVLVVALLVITIPIMNESFAIRELKSNSKNLTEDTYVAEISRQVANNQDNPQNLILLADVALSQGEIDLSYQIANRIRELDARSFYGQYLPAIAYEATSKPAEAIKFREKLVQLDPWNTSNMLQLIKNYLAVGDRTKARDIAVLIKENYPGSQSDIDASALLVG